MITIRGEHRMGVGVVRHTVSLQAPNLHRYLVVG